MATTELSVRFGTRGLSLLPQHIQYPSYVPSPQQSLSALLLIASAVLPADDSDDAEAKIKSKIRAAFAQSGKWVSHVATLSKHGEYLQRILDAGDCAWENVEEHLKDLC